MRTSQCKACPPMQRDKLVVTAHDVDHVSQVIYIEDFTGSSQPSPRRGGQEGKRNSRYYYIIMPSLEKEETEA